MSKIRTAIGSLPVFPVLYRARRNSDMKPEELANIALRFPFIRALQVREEMVKFLQVVAELKPTRILEIGTCRGGTLFSICRLASPDATIISLDLPPGRLGGGYGYNWFQIPAFWMFTSAKQKLYLVRDDSHSQETFKRVVTHLRGQLLDLLFVDGDHTYEGVKSDFEMYSRLVRRGGVVAFHDIVEHPPEAKCGVSRLWNEVKQHYQYSEIVKDWEQRWAGIGVLYR